MADPDAPIAVLNALIRERDARTRANADLDEFLGGRDLTAQDREAIASVGAKRWMVYRSLVHNRMRNTIREFIERTAARIGIGRLKADVTDWLHERAAVSPYLRDVPHEFVEWVAPRWRDDPAIPDYIVDLARHELLEYLVFNDPAGGDEPTGEPLALDRPLRFDGAARLVRYDFAVHRLPLDEDNRSEPDAGLTELLVYRDAKHKVRYLELTELAAAVLRHLLQRKAGVADGLRAACEELGVELSDERLAISAQLLADLADRGVMLGAETG